MSFFTLWTVYTCNACWFYVFPTCKRLFEPSVVLINKINKHFQYRFPLYCAKYIISWRRHLAGCESCQRAVKRVLGRVSFASHWRQDNQQPRFRPGLRAPANAGGQRRAEVNKYLYSLWHLRDKRVGNNCAANEQRAFITPVCGLTLNERQENDGQQKSKGWKCIVVYRSCNLRPCDIVHYFKVLNFSALLFQRT